MKILITAIGCPGFTTVYESIKKIYQDIEVHGCDIQRNTNENFVDQFFIVPRGKSDNYIEIILSYCIKNKVTHVIPMSDDEIVAIGSNIEKFNVHNIDIFGEARANIEGVFNKAKLYKSLKELGFVPRFRHIENSKDFLDAYQHFAASNTKMCVKPSLSHGSRGFALIGTVSYEDYLSKKQLNKITPDHFLSIIKDKQINLVAMEYLSGREYSVDAIMYKDQFYCVVRSRDETINGISSKCTIHNISELKNYSKLIYKKLGFVSLVNLQFKQDCNGKYKLLEINPRIPGGISFSMMAGIDMLKIAFCKYFQLSLENFKTQPAYGLTIEKKWKLIKY